MGGSQIVTIDADLLARYDRRVPRYTSYPTAPHFSASIGREIYTSWLRALPTAETLSLYLHVPFCAELCLYCGCHTTVARRYAPIGAYMDLLEREIALVAQHLGERRRVTHIHWGGGTPNIVSPTHLIKIMQILRARFDVGDDAEIAVEIDPRTLTLAQVGAFGVMGVNRASLGVQDFDETVQRAVGRIQSYETTAQAVRWLRRACITSLNLDLMYGLPHQTVCTVIESVARALMLEPDRVAMFGYAHVPWMKRHQTLLPVEALPDAAERLRQMQAASAAIQQAGYVPIGLDHFTRPEDRLAHSQRDGHLRRNFQGYTTDEAATLIGFGTSSISMLPEGYVQNESSTAAYRRALSSGRLATARGIALSTGDQLRRTIIERLMCDLEVDLGQLAPRYGEDPRSFQPELEMLDRMALDGLVARQGYRISVPDEARPLLRSVCAVFDRYLPAAPSKHSLPV
jgi:oxygen-independent coproporphyrinogen-3 oxidase